MLYVENEKLKEKYKSSIDEKQSMASEAEQKAVRLQEHLENVKAMFNKKLVAQKEMLDEMSRLRGASEVKLKTKITECAQLTQQV